MNCSKTLPLWKTALMASPESFGVMPADYSPRFLEKPHANVKTEMENFTEGVKKERQTLYYISVKNCVCADFGFLESIATAFHRVKESGELSPEGGQSSDGSEKIYLKGNIFLYGLAKAILEQNEDDWIAACEKYGSEAYFEECAKLLTEQGWAFENAGEAEGESKSGDESKKPTKESWASLYSAIFLLTEEYLHTNGELPKLECNAISAAAETSNEIATNAATPPSGENNLKIIFSSLDLTEEILSEARLIPIKPVPCSSDFLSIGADFFDFLCKNFPYANTSSNEFSMFMQKIYDEDVCKDLSWLRQAIAEGTPPLPDFIGTAIMEPNKLGAYKDKKIYINHRLALDSLKHPQARFAILLAMLHEYGHFLDDVLHEKSSGGLCSSQTEQCDSRGEEGENFASLFLENSPSDLLHSDFKFANFIAPDPKGNDKVFPMELKTSEFSEKERMLQIHYSVMNSSKKAGNIKLPIGEELEDVELWGINFRGSGHEDLTESAAKEFGYPFGGLNGQDLEEGCAWPDVPYATDVHKTTTNYAYFLLIFGNHKIGRKYNGDLTYESHFGKNQHWHSMCPKDGDRIFTNSQVKEKILEQLFEWYNDAFKYKNGLFHIGKMLHTIQDSYCIAHCWRHFDKKNSAYNGYVWSFQGYDAQDSGLHGVADSSYVKNLSGEKIQSVGYKKALEATKFILSCYKNREPWQNLKRGKLYEYLNNSVYVIHPDREDYTAGECHEWFKKGNPEKKDSIENSLYILSEENPKW